MANCGDFDGLRAASLYGDLTAAERKALDAHLAGCAACRREIEEFQGVLEVLPPPSLRLSALERERLIRSTRPRSYRWIAVVAAAASLLLAALLLRPRPSTPPPPAAPAVAERPVPKPPVPPPTTPKPEPPPPTRTKVPDSFVQPPKPVLVPEPAPPTPEPEPVMVPPPPAPRPTIAAIAKFEGKDVFPGDTLSARGRLLYGDGTDLLLGQGTTVHEQTGPEGKRLVLLQGELRASVAKQPAGQPLRIVAGESTAVVLGTVLRVARHEAATRLEVHEGRVRLDRAEGAVDVPAGRYVDALPGRAADLKPLRATLGLQALYTFSEGGGRRVLDRTGAHDLSIGAPGRTLWGPDGLSVNGTPLIATDGPATRLIEACRASNAITLEAWIRPAKPMLGFDGAILALSSDNQDRNFALVQGQNENGSSAFEASLRTSTTNNGGDKPLVSPRRLVEPALTHVVFTRTAAGVEHLYVNGIERSSRTRPGTFANWSGAFRLELGDERTQERPWSGTYRLVAVYARALLPAEVKRNFSVGADGW